MNHDTPVSRPISQWLLPSTLQGVEREASRLLAEHAHDPVTRTAIVFDLKVRRAAYRIAARLKRIGSGLES